MPALLAANATRRVDVLLWECHFGARVHGVLSSCWRLRDRIRDFSGLPRGAMHHEPSSCKRQIDAAATSRQSNWDCYSFPERPPPAAALRT